jgi:hypothetical protein
MNFSERFSASIFRIKYNVPGYDFNITHPLTNVSEMYVVTMMPNNVYEYFGAIFYLHLQDKIQYSKL